MILDFLELHRAEQNEARHNLMLGLLDRVSSPRSPYSSRTR
jgi:hypothetical protein